MSTLPEALYGQVLAAYDNDKTAFMTSETLEGGHTVEEAYEIAVEETFGFDALQAYRHSDGLRNRAPIEVAEQLAPSGSSIEDCLEMGEKLVESKLKVLTPQIGRLLPDGVRWPRPNEGYAEHWHEVNNTDGVTTSIVSSGHTDFILKSFEVHELEAPNVMVTDDDMRPLMLELPLEACQKPSRLLLDTAVKRWVSYLRLVDVDPELIMHDIMDSQVIFAGDDPVKDGQTAHNAGAEFMHIPVGAARPAFEKLTELVLSKAKAGAHVVD